MTSLDGPRLKVGRAKKHIDQIQVCCADFLAMDPYDVLEEPNPNGGQAGKQWRMVVRADPPPEIALTVGDAIHNLRAALDLLTWQLILANGKNPEREAFPVGNNRTEFETGRYGIKTLKGRISSDAFKVLRELKPYQGGNDSLWRLHKLDIVDKHRLMLVVGAAFQHLILTFSPPGWDQTFEHAVNPEASGFPLKDGDLLPLAIDTQATFTSTPGGPEPQMNQKLSFSIALNEPGIVEAEPLDALLNGLTGTVESTIQAFAFLL